jgi:hypothetical protein
MLPTRLLSLSGLKLYIPSLSTQEVSMFPKSYASNPINRRCLEPLQSLSVADTIQRRAVSPLAKPEVAYEF